MEIPTLPLPSPPPQTPTTTTTTTTVKTPDPESEAPQSTKQLSLPLTTNGILKRHKPLHHHQPPPLIVVTYKECLKNHAAVMGGHAVDGCGEFMPSPSSSPSYPTSLKCAACGCHRNFHRREPEESLFSPPIQHVIEYQPHHRHHPPPPPPPQTQPKPQPQQLLPLPPPPPTGDDVSPGNSPSPPPISSSYYPSAPHMLLALSTGLPSPPVENNHTPTTGGSGAGSGSYPNGKKRFRTKFTQDQKGKMHEIAERIGWKMQKRDEDMINGFCNEIGIERNVFKVWMHNNKITNIGNNSNNNNNNNSVFINNGNGNGNGNDNHISTAEQVNRGIDFMISRNNNEHDLHIRNIDSFSTGGNLVATKGSSST